MSLIENYAAERKARLARLGMGKKVEPPKPTVEAELVKELRERDSLIAQLKSALIEKEIYIQAMKGEDGRFSVVDVQSAVAGHFRIFRDDMIANGRSKDVTYPRQVAYYLCRRLTSRSLTQIGKRFTGRDHTSVLHGVKKIDRLRLSDWMVAYDVAMIERSLGVEG